MASRTVVVASTARTGLAKSFRGGFNKTHGAAMLGHTIKHAVARASVDPAEVDDVIAGCGFGEGATGARPRGFAERSRRLVPAECGTRGAAATTCVSLVAPAAPPRRVPAACPRGTRGGVATRHSPSGTRGGAATVPRTLRLATAAAPRPFLGLSGSPRVDRPRRRDAPLI